ncbi:MAG: DUF72 domain-containing protein, partial [Bdellovibrionota bacterium]
KPGTGRKVPRTKAMKQVDLFSAPKKEHPYADLGNKLWSLAEEGVYFGSSSWKYESWQGSIYVEEYRSKKDFEQNCLKEYSEIFPTVGGDFSFYNWPSEDMLGRAKTLTREGFKIGLKCTELITLKRFPSIPRWRDKAGKENPDFLNADLFKDEFLKRVEVLGDKLGPVIFEFTAFPKGSFSDWTEFAIRLETFFEKLPRSYLYSVEIRNRDFLHRDFWGALKAMGAAPVLNSWTRMPPLDEQWKLFPEHDFDYAVCRPVMKPGRTRDEALHLFEPYDRLKEVAPAARRAFLQMTKWAREKKRPLFIFVNNHLEGCAYQTIAEVTSVL